MNKIKLIVGLGNPGEKYEKTRHNAGFWFVDLIAAQNDCKLTTDAKMFGIVGKLNADTWLLKPTTFMNASGKAVAAIANYFKIMPAEILVVHDELDLPPGTAKLKLGGGRSGNGIKDIISALGTENFWRLRIGIGRPTVQGEMANYVLSAPSKQEHDALEASIDEAVSVVPSLLTGDFDGAMLKLHTK